MVYGSFLSSSSTNAMILRFHELDLSAPHRNAVLGCGRLRAELENASEIKIFSAERVHLLTPRSACYEPRNPRYASSSVLRSLLGSMPQGEEKANLNRSTVDSRSREQQGGQATRREGRKERSKIAKSKCGLGQPPEPHLSRMLLTAVFRP